MRRNPSRKCNPVGVSPSDRCARPMVEHYIDNNACQRDVNPNRKCHPSDPSVTHPILSPGTVKCDESEERDDCRKNDVRRQNEQVNTSKQRSLVSESFSGHSGVMIQSRVIRQVTCQKQDRCHKRRHHDASMGSSVSSFDQNVTGHQHDPGEAVEARVDCGKSRCPGRKFFHGKIPRN